MTVKVIDSVMGSGKSTWFVSSVADGTIKEPVLYITPFLEEVTDKINMLAEKSIQFTEPKAKGKDNKSDDLNNLLSEAVNVATTHLLLQTMNQESLDSLIQNGYTVVIDEAVNAFDYLHVEESDTTDILLKNKMVIVDEESKQVRWNNIEFPSYSGKLNYVRNACDNGAVFLTPRFELFIWEFPTRLFEVANEIYVCTYPFDHTLMRVYFDINNIKYEKLDPVGLGLRSEKEMIESFSELLNIYEGKSNDIGKSARKNKPENDTTLSSSWFGRNKSKHKQLGNKVYNVFKQQWGQAKDDVIWTSYKDHQSTVKPNGYAGSFLQCASRGTNEYRDRTSVAYLINPFLNPDISAHIQTKDGDFDQSKWALGEMLQWLWRGCIRRGEPMNAFIPSIRMRTTLNNWLNGEYLA